MRSLASPYVAQAEVHRAPEQVLGARLPLTAAWWARHRSALTTTW